MPRAFRRTKLAQRLGFNLPDSLTGYVKFLTDLFEGMLALAADAEAQPDHLFLFRRQVTVISNTAPGALGRPRNCLGLIS
jgi:hypothetical protein